MSITQTKGARAAFLSIFVYQAYMQYEGLWDISLPNGYNLVITLGDQHFPSFGFIAQSASTIVIAFRGTEEWKDIYSDIRIRQIPYPFVPNSGHAHKGFVELYGRTLRTKIMDTLNRLAPRKALFLTGHSLGGAIATLCAVDVAANTGFRPSVYTFGSPRVGDLDFVRAFRKRIGKSVRIANRYDHIPLLPPHTILSRRYRHVHGYFPISFQAYNPIGNHGISRYSRTLCSAYAPICLRFCPPNERSEQHVYSTWPHLQCDTEEPEEELLLTDAWNRKPAIRADIVNTFHVLYNQLSEARISLSERLETMSFPPSNLNFKHTLKRWLPYLAFGACLTALAAAAITDGPAEPSARKAADSSQQLPAEQSVMPKAVSGQAAAKAGAKPNVIIMLSEAFWDPTQMKNASFSSDPVPFFHSLQSTYSSGWMLSPQFGGGTANVEFEVLTGNSMRFLPEEIIAYEEYVTRGVDSLASILSRQGYTATAINPFHSYYFNSKDVYKHLGFSRFISLEYFPPDYAGPYIADRAVVGKIIEETQKSPGPDVIFANTMENHFHYWPGKFKDNTIKVKGVFSSKSKGLLETLAQGLSGADNSLKILVDHFAESSEPTVIVFFGDHLPYLEKNYEVYRDVKFLQENDPDELEKMHRVPVVVWDNFLPEHRDQLAMSPSFLGPYVLKKAGLEGTPYTDFLSSLSAQIPVIPPKESWTAYHIEENALAAYMTKQQDILTGEQSTYGADKSRIEPADYVLGYGDLKLDTADRGKPSFITGDSTVTVKGGRFGLGSVVYINGQSLKTEWIDEHTLTATLPKSAAVETASLTVEVCIVDDKGNVLTQSNQLSL